MKLNKKDSLEKQRPSKLYNHYIGLEWSEKLKVLARMRHNSLEPVVHDNISNLKDLKGYLDELKGSKILTIEETTEAHWLYVELKEHVDKVIICNPTRNHLLKEGPKDDKIDARKLALMLRNGMLKEVYHTDDENNYKIRKLVSSYDDLVIAHVRLQNQYSAIHRSEGLNPKKEKYNKKDKYLNFIIESQIELMKIYEDKKKKYEELFEDIEKENEIIRYIDGISGFGTILSVKAYGIIIDINRFKNKYRFWCYGGLVKTKRESGKRSFRKKTTQYSRKLKYVLKTATLAALRGENDIREYYEYLLREEGFTDKDAKNAVTRYIATSLYAVMKNKTKYEPYSWRKKLTDKAA